MRKGPPILSEDGNQAPVAMLKMLWMLPLLTTAFTPKTTINVPFVATHHEQEDPVCLMHSACATGLPVGSGYVRPGEDEGMEMKSEQR